MLKKWSYIEEKWRDGDMNEPELFEDHAEVLGMSKKDVAKLSKILSAPIERGWDFSVLNPLYKRSVRKSKNEI